MGRLAGRQIIELILPVRAAFAHLIIRYLLKRPALLRLLDLLEQHLDLLILHAREYGIGWPALLLLALTVACLFISLLCFSFPQLLLSHPVSNYKEIAILVKGSAYLVAHFLPELLSVWYVLELLIIEEAPIRSLNCVC